jgi:hypothetical protein
MKRKPRHVVRLIKDGRVKIYDHYYYPSVRWKEYDGRCDGMRYYFGLYWSGDKLEPYVSMWGSERYWKERRWSEIGPELVAGKFPWKWWYRDRPWPRARKVKCPSCGNRHFGTE